MSDRKQKLSTNLFLSLVTCHLSLGTGYNEALMRLGKIIIILFCLCHIFTVTSLPLEANDPLTVSARNHLRPVVMPYLFATSQWQQWNLFSPDPLRRVTTYILQTHKKDSNVWQDFAVINRKTVPWSALSRELKLLGNLESEKGYEPIRKALLQTYCRTLNLPTGTPVRLVYEQYVLPQPATPESKEFWQKYVPKTSRAIDTDILCHVTIF